MHYHKDSSLPVEPKLTAWVSIFFLVLSSAVGALLIAPLLDVLVLFLFDEDVLMISESPLSIIETPEHKWIFLILQTISSVSTFIIAPAAYVYFFNAARFSFFQESSALPLRVGLSCLIVLLFIVPNSIFIEWNAHLSFPGFLSPFESWMRRQEDMMERITTFVTTFQSWQDFSIALLVIALIPGVGEELLFRGMLQPEFHRATKNIHISIILTSILFSAIHMQFFGFFPRLFIGVLLGYTYYWSKNIFVPIAGHFINNGFMLTVIYLRQLDVISVDLESEEAAPWPYVLVSSLCITGLMVWFHRIKSNAK